MTSIGSAGPASSALFQRLFNVADADKDKKVTGAELSDLFEQVGKTDEARDIIAANDTDSDGALSAKEWPHRTVSDQTMGQLLSIQEYAAISTQERQRMDKQAIADFFTRADIDGNGTLSREELDAQRQLTLAQTMDAGEQPRQIYMVKPEAGDGELTQDDFLIGRRLDVTLEPVDMTQLDDETRARLEDMKAQFARLRDAAPPPAAPLSRQEQMQQQFDSAEFTNALMARLITQLTQGKGEQPAAAIRDVSA